MRKYLYLLPFLLFYNLVSAQSDNSIINLLKEDSVKLQLNMDAVYNRPFLQFGKMPITIGGYGEANVQYGVTDGIDEGYKFQMRRLTLFFSSSIQRNIKFLSEIEFEDGTKEINIEFAAIDIQFHPLLNLRGGIVMNPIGGFNQNHDGPRWEFIDRPISATLLLPSTFSNVGFGLFGKSYKPNFVWAYEIYLTNGFNDNIITNTENKTFLPATKLDPNRFEESFNGIPLLSVKTSLRIKKVGELGLSYLGGVYNQFIIDGFTIDKKRRVDVVALDYNTIIPVSNTSINTEFAWIMIDVPQTYSQQFGDKQYGGFIDIVQPILKKRMFNFENATINLALRTEFVDWNKGTFRETGSNIYDHIFAISPAVSLRPSSQTVLRLNYRYHAQSDLFGNPTTNTAIIQFGFSSYF